MKRARCARTREEWFRCGKRMRQVDLRSFAWKGRIFRLAVVATAAAKGLAALPIVTFEKGRARTPLRAGAGTANRQMRPAEVTADFCTEAKGWRFG